MASAVYGFVRFIGGGPAPSAAGKLVEATNVHVPFVIAAGALLIGIAILTTARRDLPVAERVQAGETLDPATVPAPRLEPAGPDRRGADGAEVARVAARLATLNGRTVDVLHAQEAALTDASATQELWRHARCHIVIVNDSRV